MKKFKIITIVLCILLISSSLFLISCRDTEKDPEYVEPELKVVMKEISKEEYVNKTLGGLLGQIAGFLSGYEFVFRGPDPYIGMPESWFEFLNGPYAGNFSHYVPYDTYRYDRLRINPQTGRNEVWSDDDYHLDIFNQLIMDEFGTSSYAIKEAWKKYNVSDWGGGGEAMRLINSCDMLAPYTGTIEAGNKFGWCTESYIENETLGMNAPGMPQTAILLTDTFASNVGYFEPVIWAKFYATMYSLAYFETDIVTVMEKASVVLPKGSFPRRMYEMAIDAYNRNKDNYVAAAQELVDARRQVYRIDNVQTDPNVNGGFAVLSWLYGNNSYLETCKYSSIMGYDGDCTAATCAGVMGILKGFKEGNEEYEDLNSKIYYDGEGVYYDDDGTLYDGDIFQAHIKSDLYPTRQKIDDIIDLYRKNFEKILLENGGKIEGDKYIIPTTQVPNDTSILFDNYDAEKRTTEGFTTKNGTLENVVETENVNSHSGYAYFNLVNTANTETYHRYENLTKGRKYRVSVFVKGSSDAQIKLFARNKDGEIIDSITFETVDLINKTFTFTADGNVAEVGFVFDKSAPNGATLSFDDFTMEAVSYKEIYSAPSDLKLTSNTFVKTIQKPQEATIGKEVTLVIKYRNYSGATPIKVYRNGELFGSVMASNTSSSSTSGYSYLEIPYVFEKESDVVKLDFAGYKMFFGDIKINTKTSSMFR